MFKIDYNEASDFEPIKPGEYEVIPVRFEKKLANSGNERIIMNYEIRSDVDQPCQGQKILYDNFTITQNSMWRFHSASKAAKMPDGMDFKSMEEWAQTFLNKPIRVDVEEHVYNGKPYPRIKFFKESEALGGVKPSEDPFKDDGKPIEISSDDLPF